MRLSLLAVLTGLTGLLCYCVFVRHWDGALAALVIGGAGLVASLLLIGALLLVAPGGAPPGHAAALSRHAARGPAHAGRGGNVLARAPPVTGVPDNASRPKPGVAFSS
ncbi:uncharacterized protein (DUF58 family) [Paraburkholderia sp. RAU6.4a]|uniref:hypothetical protein n=1 Tax=Paraburkholderia sp. RAU6.4a TaxID=2991067 RepID=UPI003D21D96B